MEDTEATLTLTKYPTLRELCLDQVRSPLRMVIDCVLVVLLFAAYVPQWRSTLRQSPPKTSRSYIMLGLLFVTLLNTSYMSGFLEGRDGCFTLGHFPGALSPSETFRALTGVVQVTALWVCEVITCLCYTYASRPFALRSPTPSIRVEDEEDGVTDETTSVTEADVEERTPLLRSLSPSTHTTTPSKTPSSAFRLSATLTSLMVVLSTALFAWIFSMATELEGTPDWCGEFKCRSAIIFMLSFLAAVLLLLMLYGTTVRRLWKGGNMGLQTKALIGQAVVMVLIAGSLGVKGYSWNGGRLTEVMCAVLVGAFALLKGAIGGLMAWK